MLLTFFAGVTVGVYKKVIELDADATRGVLPHGGLNSRWQVSTISRNFNLIVKYVKQMYSYI